MHSKLNIEEWRTELEEDVDKDFLLQGLQQGFDIIMPDSELRPVRVHNHSSALSDEVRPQVEELINKEIRQGNYIVTSHEPTIISAIGAVGKSDGGYRLIHDCSLPSETCLNSYAPEFDKYNYESIDTAVGMIKQGYYLAKIDIKSAYRHIPISVSSQRATGLYWRFADGTESFLRDSKLPFGAKASPTIFHRISQAVKRMMVRRGYQLIVAYQDDFLVIGETYDACLEAWMCLINLLLRLGFELSYPKLVAPTMSLVFLGIQIDTGTCELSLPETKLSQIQDKVSSFVHRKRATKQQLQSLAGSLNFAARVVRGGRTFLRRILDSIAKLRQQHHKVRLRGAIRGDIAWWNSFLKDFNGAAAFIEEAPITPILTDSCTTGAGAFCNGDFRYVNWEADYPELASQHINVKEAMIAALAVRRWGHLCQNRTIYLYIDNQCAVWALNKATCKSEVVMEAIREMFWASVKYNFVVKAQYMAGCKHVIADCLSRLHEPARLLQWESYLNNWYACHYHVYDMMTSLHLCNHMSLAALATLLSQVLDWRTQRQCWTERWQSTERQLTQS